MENKTNDLNEAPAIVFTNFKRPDGFEVSLTLRGDTGTELLAKMDKAIKQLITEGCTPVVKGYGNKQNRPEKVIEYVEGGMCPLDGGRLVKPQPGSKAPIKCENNRWNFQLKKAEGCTHIEWPEKKNQYPVRQVLEDY